MGREQVVDEPAFRVRAVLGAVLMHRPAREVLAMRDLERGQAAVSAVQARVSAVQLLEAPIGAPAVPVLPRAARIGAPAALLRTRPVGTLTPEVLGIGALGLLLLGALGLLLLGARLPVAGRRRLDPCRGAMAGAVLRVVDGTGRDLDATVQPLRGGTLPEVAERK